MLSEQDNVMIARMAGSCGLDKEHRVLVGKLIDEVKRLEDENKRLRSATYYGPPT